MYEFAWPARAAQEFLDHADGGSFFLKGCPGLSEKVESEIKGYFQHNMDSEIVVWDVLRAYIQRILMNFKTNVEKQWNLIWAKLILQIQNLEEQHKSNPSEETLTILAAKCDEFRMIHTILIIRDIRYTKLFILSIMIKQLACVLVDISTHELSVPPL